MNDYSYANSGTQPSSGSQPNPPYPPVYPNPAQPYPNPAQPYPNPAQPYPNQPHPQSLNPNLKNLIQPKPKKPILLIVFLVIFILTTFAFAGLFVWKYQDWEKASTNLKSQIDKAVAVAIQENTAKLENEFQEREKYPLKKFAGPVDYGALSFEYPKTWDLFISKDASHGGNFEAYLHPDKIPPLSRDVVLGLRVSILDQPVENITKRFERQIRDKKLTYSVKKVQEEPMSYYQGELENKRIGTIAIFRIRDKTVVFQTDAKVFQAEFDKILNTIKFNK